VSTLHEQLMRDIIEGKHPIGSLFTEVGLSRDSGLSRTSVREAVQLLAQEGFVEKAPRGWRVRDRSPDQILALYDVLIPLESTAAALAADKTSSFGLARLQRLVEQRTPLKASDPQSEELNREFHEAIRELAGNDVLLSFIVQVRNLLAVYQPAFVFRPSEGQENDEHAAIVKAIAARDPRLARDAMADHLARGRNSLVEAFLEDPARTYRVAPR
jgi:DNA-binding GntR family transcriptional regulator